MLIASIINKFVYVLISRKGAKSKRASFLSIEQNEVLSNDIHRASDLGAKLVLWTFRQKKNTEIS